MIGITLKVPLEAEKAYEKIGILLLHSNHQEVLQEQRTWAIRRILQTTISLHPLKMNTNSVPAHMKNTHTAVDSSLRCRNYQRDKIHL